LSAISGFVESDGTVNNVYGGDLLGNLWKFDITNSSVSRLATLTDASNNPLQVTAAPDLSVFALRRMIYVGTGKILGVSDFSNTTTTNSFFGIYDDGTEVNKNYLKATASTNVRNFLARRALTVNATTGARTVTGAIATGDTQVNCTGVKKQWIAGVCYTNPAIDWTSQRGWFVDLPVGEKANTDPTVGLGIVSWTSNFPSTVSCSSSSALYYADAATGLQLDAANFPGTAPNYGVAFATTLSSRPVITRLPSNKVAITTHQSDNTTRSTGIALTSAAGSSVGSVKKGRVTWRQVLQ
jgi:type IV pilus assembly protein PilY1